MHSHSHSHSHTAPNADPALTLASSPRGALSSTPTSSAMISEATGSSAVPPMLIDITLQLDNLERELSSYHYVPIKHHHRIIEDIKNILSIPHITAKQRMEANVHLAHCYLKGMVDIDLEAAAKKAASIYLQCSTDPIAQLYLAYQYATGWGIECNSEEAKRFFELAKSGLSDNPDEPLPRTYEEFIGVATKLRKEYEEEASHTLQEHIALGHPIAKLMLGFYHLNSNQNTKEKKYLLELAELSEEQSLHAQLMLGNHYLTKNQNLKLSAYYLEKVLAHPLIKKLDQFQFDQIHINLALCHLLSEEGVTSEDKKEEEKEGKEELKVAPTVLPVTISHEKAFTLLDYLAHNNNSFPALILLGICYEKGLGTTVSLLKAKSCYAQAAEKGYVQAQTLLALWHINYSHKMREIEEKTSRRRYITAPASSAPSLSSSTTVSPVETKSEPVNSLEILQKAAKNHCPVAQTTLAFFYLTSHESGNFYYLGNIYSINRDRKQAHVFLQQATTNYKPAFLYLCAFEGMELSDIKEDSRAVSISAIKKIKTLETQLKKNNTLSKEYRVLLAYYMAFFGMKIIGKINADSISYYQIAIRGQCVQAIVKLFELNLFSEKKFTENNADITPSSAFKVLEEISSTDYNNFSPEFFAILGKYHQYTKRNKSKALEFYETALIRGYDFNKKYSSPYLPNRHDREQLLKTIKKRQSMPHSPKSPVTDLALITHFCHFSIFEYFLNNGIKKSKKLKKKKKAHASSSKRLTRSARIVPASDDKTPCQEKPEASSSDEESENDENSVTSFFSADRRPQYEAKTSTSSSEDTNFDNEWLTQRKRPGKVDREGLEKAWKNYSQRHYSNALIEFKKLLSEHLRKSHLIEIRKGLLLCYFRLHKNREFEEIFESLKNEPFAQFYRAKYEYSRSNYENAINFAKKAIKNADRSKNIFLQATELLITIYIDLDASDKAQEIYESYGAKYPEHIQGINQLEASLCAGLNQHERAQELYQQLIINFSRFDPKANILKTYFYNLILSYLSSGKTSEALRTAEDFIERFPDLPLARITKIDCLSQRNDFHDLERYFNKLETTGWFDNIAIRMKIAAIKVNLYLFNLLDFTSAEDFIHKMQQDFPKNKEIQVAASRCYERLGNSVKALKILQDIHADIDVLSYKARLTQSLDPDYCIGIIHEIDERYPSIHAPYVLDLNIDFLKREIEKIKATTKGKRKLPKMYHYLAHFYLAEDPEKSEEIYKLCIKEFPNYLDTYVLLIEYYVFFKKSYDEADTLCGKLIEEKEKNHEESKDVAITDMTHKNVTSLLMAIYYLHLKSLMEKGEEKKAIALREAYEHKPFVNDFFKSELQILFWEDKIKTIGREQDLEIKHRPEREEKKEEGKEEKKETKIPFSKELPFSVISETPEYKMYLVNFPEEKLPLAVIQEVIKLIVSKFPPTNEFHLFGGCVRSMVVSGLGRKTNPNIDIDICCNMTVEDFLKVCSDANVFRRHEKIPNLIEACISEREIDIVCKGSDFNFQKHIIETDYTQNSLLVRLTGPDSIKSPVKIIDPSGQGICDIFNNKLETTVLPHITLTVDPARILRGLFLCMKTMDEGCALSIPPSLQNSFQEYAPLLITLPPQRLIYMLFRGFSKNSLHFYELLVELGIFDALFPSNQTLPISKRKDDFQRLKKTMEGLQPPQGYRHLMIRLMQTIIAEIMAAQCKLKERSNKSIVEQLHNIFYLYKSIFNFPDAKNSRYDFRRRFITSMRKNVDGVSYRLSMNELS
jgi:TPR repeat protein